MERIMNALIQQNILLNCTDEKVIEIKSEIELQYDNICTLSISDAVGYIRKHICKFPGLGSATSNYWLARGHPMHIAKIKAKMKSKECKSPRLSPFSIEFWIAKGHTKEEAVLLRNSKRPINFEYWVAKGYDESEAILMAKQAKSSNNQKGLKTIKERDREFDAYSNDSRPEYYIARGCTPEEAKEKVTERQTTFTLEKCIAKHGETEGLRVWQERQDKWQSTLNSKPADEIDEMNAKKSHSYEAILKRCNGDEEAAIIKYINICDAKRVKFTLETCINRHGQEDGTKLFETNQKMRKYRMSLKFYTETYGQEDGTYRFISKYRGTQNFYSEIYPNESQEFYDFYLSKAGAMSSMEWYLNKYGPTFGLELHSKHIQKLKNRPLPSPRECYAGTRSVFYIEKYGEIEGTKRYEEFCASRSSFVQCKNGVINANLKRHIFLNQEEFEKYLCEYFNMHKFLTLRSDNFRTAINLAPYQFINLVDDVDIIDTYVDLLCLDIIDKMQITEGFVRGKYGRISYTASGQILRSSLERYFYEWLLKYDIEHLIGLSYPGSRKKYDFFLPSYNKYVEIAGLMCYQEYADNMEWKKNTFGAVILETELAIDNFFKNLMRD